MPAFYGLPPLQAADVPRLFKHSGKIRNKHLSKRDTEKLVKEIWKERMADPGGRPPRQRRFSGLAADGGWGGCRASAALPLCSAPIAPAV